MPEYELRALAEPELRAADGGELNPSTLDGYAALYNSSSEVIVEPCEGRIQRFREQIRPGAFANAISGDVLALVDHDTKLVLGRTANRTLSISDDGKGLRVHIDMPNTSYANDVKELIQRGDVGGMSFKFSPGDYEWDRRTEDGIPTRFINEIKKVYEVSVIRSFPAYSATTVSLRALEELKEFGQDPWKRKLRERLRAQQLRLRP